MFRNAGSETNTRLGKPVSFWTAAFRSELQAVASQKASRVQTFILLLGSLCLPEGNAYGQKPRDEAQKITVVTVQTTAATVTQPYVCKIHAQRYINVRVLERGFLDEIKIKEGQTVKKGDLMFKIIPILRQAKLDANAAEAQLAQLEYDFAKQLLDKNLVPQNEVQRLKAKLAKAEAKRMLAKAELNFTDVRAPFDGIVDRLHEKKGKLVEEGDILTTLSDEERDVGLFSEVPIPPISRIHDRHEARRRRSREIEPPNWPTAREFK